MNSVRVEYDVIGGTATSYVGVDPNKAFIGYTKGTSPELSLETFGLRLTRLGTASLIAVEPSPIEYVKINVDGNFRYIPLHNLV